jgi:hypothetical protein
MSVLTPILDDNGDPVAANGVPRATVSSSATSVLKQCQKEPHHQTGAQHILYQDILSVDLNSDERLDVLSFLE